jgi:hypothetical protein
MRATPTPFDAAQRILHAAPYVSDRVIAATVGVLQDQVAKYRRRLGVPTVTVIQREIARTAWDSLEQPVERYSDARAAQKLGCSPYTVTTAKVLRRALGACPLTSAINAADGADIVQVDAREWDEMQAQLRSMHAQIAMLRKSYDEALTRVKRARNTHSKKAWRHAATIERLEAENAALRTSLELSKTSAGGETHFAPCRFDVSDVIETAGDATCGDRRRVEPWRIEGGALTVYNELGLGVSVKVDDALRAALSNFQKVEP